MATSGRINTGRQLGVNFYLRWTEKSQSIPNNNTTINWYAGVNSSGTTWWYSNSIKIVSGSINGSSIGTGTYSNLTLNGDHQLKSGTKTIGHNSDGKKTFNYNITGWLYGGSNSSASGSSTLDTIPRASDPKWSKSTYTVGETLTINMNRKSSSFTHTGTIQIPDNNDIKSFSGAGASYSWTPSEAEKDAIYARMPNKSSERLSFDVQTKSGSTNIGGTLWQHATINVDPNVVRPLFEDFTYLDTNSTSVAITGNNQYLIQGYSTLRAIISSANKAEAIKSASMSKYTFGIAGISVEQAYSTSDINKDIGVINSSANQTLTITAVDSRGLAKAVAKTVNIVPYSPVAITASAVRENNFESTTTVKIKGVMSLLSVGGVTKNAVNAATGVAYRYREAGGTFGSWIDRPSTTSGATITSPDFTLNLDNTKQYEIEVRVTDKLGTYVRVLNVDAGIPIMMISTTNESLSIGKTPVAGRKLDVAGDIYANNEKVATENQVPTSGSNGNGTWIRLADGGQICSVRTSVTSTSGTVWTFPMPFVGTPHVTATTSGYVANLRLMQTEVPSSTSVRIHVFNQSNGKDTGAYTAIAVGRWK